MSAIESDAVSDDNQVSEFLMRCGWLLVVVSLAAVGCFGAWLGVREYQRNEALKDGKPANVRVNLTWYSTTDPTFQWRGPVADGVYVGGPHDGVKVRVEQVHERVPVGDIVKVVHASSNPQIAQSAYTPVGRWLDYAPWVLVAFAVVFLPGAGERLHNSFLPAHRRRTLGEVHARRRDFHQSRDEAAPTNDINAAPQHHHATDQHSAGRRAAADGTITVVGGRPDATPTGSLPVASPLAGAPGPDRSRGATPQPISRPGRTKRPVLTALPDAVPETSAMTDQQNVLAPTLTSSQTRVAPAVRSLTPENTKPPAVEAPQPISEPQWEISATESFRGRTEPTTPTPPTAPVTPGHTGHYSTPLNPTPLNPTPPTASSHPDPWRSAPLSMPERDSEPTVLVEGPIRDRSEHTETTVGYQQPPVRPAHGQAPMTMPTDDTTSAWSSSPQTQHAGGGASSAEATQHASTGELWGQVPGAAAMPTSAGQPGVHSSSFTVGHGDPATAGDAGVSRRTAGHDEPQAPAASQAPMTQFHPFVVDLPESQRSTLPADEIDLASVERQVQGQTASTGTPGATTGRPVAGNSRLRPHNPGEKLTTAPMHPTGGNRVFEISSDDELSADESTEVRLLRSRSRRSKHKAPRSWN